MNATKRAFFPGVWIAFIGWVIALASLAFVIALASCSVPVAPEIHIVPDGTQIVVGTQLQLEATRHYSDGRVENVTRVVDWTTSSANALKFPNYELTPGLVTAVSAANAVIITARDPESGVIVSSAFTVVPASLRRIDVNPASAFVLARGQSHQFAAVGTYSDGSTKDVTETVLWSSANDSVATVNDMQGMRGIVSAVSAGNTSITATDGVTGLVGSTLVFVGGDAPVLRSIRVDPNPETIAVGGKTQFSATGFFSDGSQMDITSLVTWSSSVPTVASVDATGLASGLLAGETTITATEKGTAIRASAALSVTP